MSYDASRKTPTRKHTVGHVDCPVCVEACTLVVSALAPDLYFKEAFELWLSWRTLETPAGFLHVSDASYLSTTTTKDYRACARALGKFFNKLRLNQIHAGHLREYQRARAFCDQAVGNWARPCQSNRIRKEITILIRVLRDARLWGTQEQSFFKPLRPVETNVGRALQPDEQRKFLTCAASRVEWQFIYWYAVLALQTTASTNELRSLRIGDILIEQRLLQVRREGAKNKYRMRTIPLETPEVIFALQRLIDRAKKLGSGAPHHYLFPIAAAKGIYNPNFPMSDSGLKKRWNAVRSAAGLDWLRPYDMRHTAITRMAEAGVPIHVIMSFAGHMTMRMQQHYTTISLISKREWAREAWEEPSGLPPKKGPRRAGENQSSTGYPHNFKRRA